MKRKGVIIFYICITLLIGGLIVYINGNRRKIEHEPITIQTNAEYVQLEEFFKLVHKKYPEINIKFVSYNGANRTSYSKLLLQNNEMTDIYLTNQILDENAAKKNLLDLSTYDFINNYSTYILDKVEIDGGLYLLPNNMTIYGILYNKTMFEENGWKVPNNYNELEELSKKIKKSGKGVCICATNLTGGPFSYLFNLAKTDWLATPSGSEWEQGYLNGEAKAKGQWEDTLEYASKWKDIGMLDYTEDDILVWDLIDNEFKTRKYAMALSVGRFDLTENKDGSGDEYGIMPFISEDGEFNIYMSSPARYVGLSKSLAKTGNEQKLEDAIKIMELMSTKKGQKALGSGKGQVMSLLKDNNISKNAPLYDVYSAMDEGKVIPMTYVNWETRIVDIGQNFKDFIMNKKSEDEVIESMDKLNKKIIKNGSIDYVKVKKDFTMEESAKLVAAALATDAKVDVGLCSIGDFHDGLENMYGVCGKLFKGKVSDENINTILPGKSNTYAILELTGNQIKQLEKNGFDLDGNNKPYKYITIKKNGLKLEDNKIYKVATVTYGYTKEIGESGKEKIVEKNELNCLKDYYTKYDNIEPKDVVIY